MRYGCIVDEAVIDCVTFFQGITSLASIKKKRKLEVDFLLFVHPLKSTLYDPLLQEHYSTMCRSKKLVLCKYLKTFFATTQHCKCWLDWYLLGTLRAKVIWGFCIFEQTSNSLVQIWLILCRFNSVSFLVDWSLLSRSHLLMRASSGE